MSIPKISGREARELLDVCPPWDRVKIAQTVDLDHGPDRAVLAASAHDLAETVAWLYGRQGGDGLHITLPNGYDVWSRDGVVHLEFMDMTPDGAVDLARALLATAEEARRAYEDRRYGDSDAYRRFWEGRS